MRSGSIRERFARWLFRVGPPERAPIVLGQRRIFVLPSAPGFAFATALLVMLVAAINYGLSLGYGFVFLVSAIGFVSMVHAFRNLLGLSITPGRAEPVFAGEVAHFEVLVANGREARRPGLRLCRGEGCSPFSLAPRQTAGVAVAVPTTRRGWVRLGRVILETTYPLGLIRAWSVFVPDARCLVYAAPERDPPPLPASRGDGLGTAAERPGDDDFAGLRAHRAADSPRHVAWKVLARTGTMLTKQFSGLAGGDLEFDWADLPAELGEDGRIARLTAWVLAAEARQQPYALRLPGWHSETGLGGAHRHRCLERLALYGTRSDAAPA